jgi:ABC-type sugar transport system ATPase subunit
MALLTLENVEARYGPIKALHGVSLAVEEGQAVALLGANGAGKTTTLRAISGTVRATGEIRFGDRRISHRAPETIARCGIVHVPEGRGIYGLSATSASSSPVSSAWRPAASSRSMCSSTQATRSSSSRAISAWARR